MADTITAQEAHNRAVKAGVLAGTIIMATDDGNGVVDSSMVDDSYLWDLALHIYNPDKPQASEETRDIVRGILERIAMIREDVGNG